MRIFSDTPRDRPVFDAYPMPPVQQEFNNNGFNMLNTSHNPGNTFANPSANGNMGLQVPNQNQTFAASGTSPFTFPVDPTNTTVFPTFDPRTFGQTQQPQLDPAVESILTSYFPQPQTSSNTMGTAGVPQVPDDFLSKVFNFGWDTTGTGGQQQQGDQGHGQQQQHQGQGQGQGQMQMGGNDMMGMGNGVFDGWSAHGWMA